MGAEIPWPPTMPDVTMVAGDVKILLREADTDDDKQISKAEFFAAMRKPGLKTKWGLDDYNFDQLTKCMPPRRPAHTSHHPHHPHHPYQDPRTWCRHSTCMAGVLSRCVLATRTVTGQAEPSLLHCPPPSPPLSLYPPSLGVDLSISAFTSQIHGLSSRGQPGDA